MEGILAILLIFGGGTAVMISFSPIGRAIAERLRRRPGEAAPPSEELDELRERLDRMQHQLSELAERQDFAERMLARVRNDRGLPSGPDVAG
jgi:hypothetical protein